MSDDLTPELVSLVRFEITLKAPFVIPDTPVGTRMIFEIESATAEGDRLRGKLQGQANGDWMTLGADGTGALDVRALLETHDGALVYIQYHGRTDLSSGGPAPIYIAPRFETGDERYRWLNKVQAVGKGSYDGTTLRYEIFELR